MKVAFVDNLPVGGGLSRFSFLLCKSLLEADDSVEISYLVNAVNLERTPELKSLSNRVHVISLESTASPNLFSRAIGRIGSWTGRKYDNEGVVMKEVAKKVKGHDMAYFPSAHMMKFPMLDIPIVGTVHDFNWKYFFGRQIFSEQFVEQMDREIVKWMTMAETISSSYDVITEARKLYPNISSYPEVIHIAPVVFSNHLDDKSASVILKEIEVDYPYILFPGNFFPHKNHLNLFSAFFRLRKRSGFGQLKLLLSGMNTDQVSFGIAEWNGIRLVSNADDYDVRGLGYQPNRVVDALIKNARLVVSPSLYEAICTPGMDAWSFGTPTAISDIPPFREHEKVWNIKSAFFNPMDPVNIADVLERYLNNYEKAASDGRISQSNMMKYSWNDVAKSYLEVFRRAAGKL